MAGRSSSAIFAWFAHTALIRRNDRNAKRKQTLPPTPRLFRGGCYSVVLPAALAAFHRAMAAAAIFALDAALIFRLGLRLDLAETAVPFIFAHLAF